jgi:hypothetical protein
MVRSNQPAASNGWWNHDSISGVTQARGFATAHSGKPSAYRDLPTKKKVAAPPIEAELHKY